MRTCLESNNNNEARYKAQVCPVTVSIYTKHCSSSRPRDLLLTFHRCKLVVTGDPALNVCNFTLDKVCDRTGMALQHYRRLMLTHVIVR